MTYNERDILLKSTDYIGKVKIALADWVNYWAVNGTASIEDPDLKQMTDTFLKVCLENPDAYVNKIAVLAISESVVKDAVEVSDANVSTAVTHLMSTALEYIL